MSDPREEAYWEARRNRERRRAGAGPLGPTAGFRVSLWRLRARDDPQERIAEVRGLAFADAVDVPERLERPGLDARELAQRRVVKDDVWRHSARPRDREA